MTRATGDGRSRSQRQLRIGEEIRHALVRVLARGDLRDPDLVDANPTVSEVRVSPDLKNATAFVVPFAGGDPAALVKACRRAAPHLRARVAEELRLRHVPALSFEPDRSFDQAAAIDRVLRSDAVARDIAGDGEA